MNLQVIGRKSCYAVAVTSSATALSTNGKRLGLIIRNNDSINPVYLGKDSTVTTANGFPLLPGEVLQDLDAYDPNQGDVDTWYAIAASSVDVRVIEYLP
jgi:hypothetical protein